MNCVVCGNPSTARWTIDNQHDIAVVDLCVIHSDPLQAILEKASPPPPVVERADNVKKLVRHPRQRQMAPLDWTPPS
jgi:hypothetical protein